MKERPKHPAPNGDDRPLTVYLRDHCAGARAGLALVRRCRREHAGTALDATLADIEAQIEEDRRSLEKMMSRLGVRPSAWKSAVGSLSEMVSRLKGNGRIFRQSPSSAVVELEGLAAGIVTKRNLWRSLRAVAVTSGRLDAAELDTLAARATAQLNSVLDAHVNAARQAFATPDPVGTAAFGGERTATTR